MSTQRRRVLEDDGGKTTITDNGVYIEGLNGKFYTKDNWQYGHAANSVVVASGDVKFRVALTEPSDMALSNSYYTPFENYMGTSDSTAAKADYDGAGNTEKMLNAQPSTAYAAGYCNAFVFPDGRTKGYLPSLGQLNLLYQYRPAIYNTLTKCGGTYLKNDGYYWSSTFGAISPRRMFWEFSWKDGFTMIYDGLTDHHYVRPFANLS